MKRLALASLVILSGCSIRLVMVAETEEAVRGKVNYSKEQADVLKSNQKEFSPISGPAFLDRFFPVATPAPLPATGGVTESDLGIPNVVVTPTFE